MPIFLVFDTETTGLIRMTNKFRESHRTKKTAYPSYKNEWSYKLARAIQISWTKTSCFEPISLRNVSDYYRKITKDDYFRIFNHQFRGITNKICDDKGIDIRDILLKFKKDLDKSDYLVGYNVYFDINIIKYEAYKVGDSDLIEKIDKKILDNKIVCLCEMAKKIMNKSVFPSLISFYKFKYNKDPPNSHNSKYDVYVTAKLFRKCIKDSINFSSNENAIISISV